MLLHWPRAVSVLSALFSVSLAGEHHRPASSSEPCSETDLPPPPITEAHYPPPPASTITITTTEICTVTKTEPPLPPSTVTCTETVTVSPPPPPTVTTTETVNASPPPPSIVTTTETVNASPPPPSTVTTTETVNASPPPPSTVTTTETVNASPPPPSIVTSTETVTSPLPPSTVTTTEIVNVSPPPPSIVTSTETVTSPLPLPSTIFISTTTTVEAPERVSTVTTTTTETQAGEATVTFTTTTTKENPPEEITVTVTEPSASPPSQPSKLPSLSEALIAAGCSNFLAYIRSNATVWAIFNSNRTQTVFAPSDAFFSFNASGTASGPRLRRAEESGDAVGDATYQAVMDRTNLSRLRNIPGRVLNTNEEKANLNGETQKVVSDSRTDVVASQSKRSLLPRSRHGGNVIYDLQSLVRVDSGLGAVTNVINADLPYTGGLIHVTDSLFTVPENTTRTAVVTGEATFAELAEKAKLVDLLDKTPAITVFIPSDRAFSAADISPGTSAADLAAALGGHVVRSTADKVGYLPNLVDELALNTTTGSTLHITVRGEDYFVNNALITKANLVLDNGVAHIIDKVLTGANTHPGMGGCCTASCSHHKTESSAVSDASYAPATPSAVARRSASSRRSGRFILS